MKLLNLCGRTFAVLLVCAWVATVSASWALEPADADVHAYVHAAETVRTVGTAYDPLPVPGPHRVGIFPWYLYPPPLAAALSFADPSPLALFRLLMVAGLAGVAAASFALARLAGLRGPWWPVGIAGALYLTPLPWYVLTGSAHIPVAGAALLALVLAPPAAAALLVAAAAVTVTPAWAAAVVLVRCPPARLAGAVMGVGLALISAAALGPAGFIRDAWTWATAVAPTLAQGQFDSVALLGSDALWTDGLTYRNLSPAFAVVAALTDPPAMGEPIPAWARLWLIAVQLGVPVLAARFTRRATWNVQAGWVLAAATAAAPIVRAAYLPLLLVAPALLWRQHCTRKLAASPSPDRRIWMRTWRTG